MNLKIVLLVTVMGLTTTLLPADAPPVKEAAIGCDRDVEEKLLQLQDEYVKRVTELVSKYQSQGELEKTVAVKKELARLRLEKSLAKKDVVEQPEELRELQKRYLDAPEMATRPIVQEHVSRLQQAKRELTNAGKLDEALTAQREIEKIQRKYGSTSQPTALLPSTSPKTERAVPKDLVAQCSKEIDERLAKLRTDYSRSVVRLQSMFQQHGNLEATVAADNEWKRFFSTATVTQKDLVGKPAELRELQQNHMAASAEVPKQVAQDYIEKLEDGKSRLTIQGKITDALLLQKDIEKLLVKYFGRAPTFVTSTTPPTPESVQVDASSVRDAVARCDKEIAGRCAQLPAEYLKELGALRQRFQQAGDLKKTLMVKREEERFNLVKRLNERDLVREPWELRALQADYLITPRKIACEVSESYIRKLDDLKRQLTVAGKLNEAVFVQRQIDFIAKKYY